MCINPKCNYGKVPVDEGAGLAKCPDCSSSELTGLLCGDIKTHMREVTDKQPINNAGSYALTLLWQIFEEASDSFEEWREIEKLNDDDIEQGFKSMFPVFIAEYPSVMSLDT